MDKKLKAKWIAALTGGRYKQCTGYMKSEGEYCCLGVLRQIMHPGSKRCWIDCYGEHEDYLCKEHQEEAGLTKRIQKSLAGMNDNGKTFEQIAAWIKKHL